MPRRRRNDTPPSSRADTGSATVWVLTLCAVVLFVASAVAIVAAVRVDRHRAASAADLAALAGAGHAAHGARPSCAKARSVATANGAVLTRCQLADDLSLRVTVRLEARMWPGYVQAHARAGPRRTTWDRDTASIRGPPRRQTRALGAFGRQRNRRPLRRAPCARSR